MAASTVTLDQLKDPSEAQRSDPIAKYVLDAYDAAKRWRSQTMLGQYSIEQTLRNCYQQYHSVITPEEAQLMEDVGADIKVSLTRYKVDILVAWLRDLFQNTSDAPFVVEPTPIPELSDEGKAEAKATMTQAFMPGGDYPSDAPPPPQPGGDPADAALWVHLMKDRQLKVENDVARERAGHMQKLIEDQLVEGKFKQELTDFLTNFAIYPYAVMLGPMVERRPFLAWSGNKARDKFENTLVCKNISPFDYFWSPDTKEGGKGTYDLVRERVSKQYLMECAKLPGYIRDNVLAAIEEFDTLCTNDWMNTNPDDSDARTINGNPPTDTVTIVRFFGKLNGKTLKLYGVTGVDDYDYVEVEAVVLGDYTLRVVTSKQPLAVGRPIYVTSYNKTPGMLAGYGIAQTIRDYERVFMGYLRNSIMNAGYSSAPIGEVDYARIQRFMPEDAIGRVTPGQLIPVDPDTRGVSGPAQVFHNIPSNLVSLTQSCSWIMQQIDQITGLPAALAGQPVGTGVNRTFRGIAQLYANALKGVQSALVNMDNDLFQPLGLAYYVYNMKYSNDNRIKGDCKVMSRGLSGLLQKELKKQDALDVLQVLAPVLQTGKVPDYVTEYAIRNALVDAGIPEDVWDEGIRRQKQAMLTQGASDLGQEQNATAPPSASNQNMPQGMVEAAPQGAAPVSPMSMAAA